MLFEISYTQDGNPEIVVISKDYTGHADIFVRDKKTGLSFISYRNGYFAPGEHFWFAYPAVLETSGVVIDIHVNDSLLESHEANIGQGTYESNFQYSCNPEGFSWFGFKEIFLDRQYGDVNGFEQVIDLGGNIGLFSSFCYINGVKKILTLEPDPNNIIHLKDNSKTVSGGDKNWKIIHGAVSYMDSLAVLKSYDKGNSSSLFSDRNDQEGEEKISTYNINTLMTLMPGVIDLMKIDCEGGEFPVFRTIKPENLARVRRIACEIHQAKFMDKDEILEKLISSGFSVQEVSPFDGKILTVYATRN